VESAERLVLDVSRRITRHLQLA